MPVNSRVETTEAGAVASIVEAQPRILSIAYSADTIPLAIVPEGAQLESVKSYFDEYRTKPQRRKGTAALFDLSSFNAHANRFKSQDSALFADPTPNAPKLVAVLNYAPATSTDFGDHRGVYAFPLSDEWLAWGKTNGTQLSQAAFAEFIENRIADIGDPAAAGQTAQDVAALISATYASPSRLLEVSRGLALNVDRQLKQQVSLANGECSFAFSEAHSDASGAPLKVPGAFLITIPVFRGGALYQLPVRLRYRAKDAKVVWFYELYRQDRVFDHAFREACDTAAKETALPLFFGMPE